MLVIVILLFAICWGPTVTDNVLTAFGYLERYNYGAVKYVRQAFSLMSYANSCVNPIVYAFMSKNFRQSFKTALWSCVPGHSLRSQQRNSTMLYQMREVSVSYAPSASFSKPGTPKQTQEDWTTYSLIPAADSGADTEAELWSVARDCVRGNVKCDYGSKGVTCQRWRDTASDQVRFLPWWCVHPCIQL